MEVVLGLREVGSLGEIGENKRVEVEFEGCW